jgi:transmembrane protein TMEM260 (protein O-mannosyltransferase)
MSEPSARVAIPRAGWALGLAIAGLTLATRWPYRVGLLPTWDAVQFALALERYDVVRHQPHPPGYILYVALGRLVGMVAGEPAIALGGLAMLASAVAVLLVYQLGWYLYGRQAAVLAALGLAVSPLFWTYSVIGLSYTAEAALATGIAISAWVMGQGSARALVASAVLLGLAGGVRQSILLILSPLWLGMAWRGFRRPRPVLAGLGVVLLTTATWLVPMLWLTGVERYVAACLELYESTVRSTTVLGGGGLLNVTRLGEALLVGLGVFLPVLWWGLRRAPARLLQGDDRAVFFALWVLPAVAVYALVHLGQPGYLLTFLPACYLLVGRTLVGLVERARRVHLPRPARAAMAGLAVASAFGAHVAFFTLAGPVDAPHPTAEPAWPARLTAELRALYRFRLWSHTAAGLREQEAVIGEYVAAIRGQFDPRDTVLVTELGNPRSYPWFRHVMYYLPEYATYHLRLGDVSPGYLVSRELPSMAPVAERGVPLPAATRRLVWVVDEWHPDLARPAALEVRPLPHGRSLYVLRVRGAVDHAGYQLVPVTTLARLR